MESISQYKTILIQTIVCLVLSSQLISKVYGAKAIYVFGDSYLDSGNSLSSNDGLPWNKPYGITWPGYPNGRACNGHIQTDYIAQKLCVSVPTPVRLLKNATNFVKGVNFAVGGAGITYAWGHATIHTQVDEFEELVKSTNVSNNHLSQSIALINIGLNDYDTYHGELQAITTWIDIVIDGLTYNIWRINKLGIKNIMVTNLVPLACVPLSTYVNNFTKCTNNETLTMTTRKHNILLAKALHTLQDNTPNMHIILLNQTRAIKHLLFHKSFQGFINTTVPCCKGLVASGHWQCGATNENGNPFYEVCSNPNKSFWWDHAHPSDASSKALIELYWSKYGFTHFGRNIDSWIKRYKL